MKSRVVAIILLSAGLIYAQTDDREILKTVNQNVVDSYRSQKLDDALKSARQAVDLSIKVFGPENPETAAAYTNLGIIFREKKNYDESIENLQKALDIYEKDTGSGKDRLIDAYQTLAFSQILGGRQKEAEAIYLKATAVTEATYGLESKEAFSPTLNLANLYMRNGKRDEADRLYLKSYAIAIKNFGKQAKEIEEIEDNRSCFLTGPNLNDVSSKSFYEERKERFGELREQGITITSRAKYLPKPKYPAEARSRRLSGSIPMRVRVDKKGSVAEVKALCGNPVLMKASEEAVRNARFEMITVDGKPAEYSGIVFYNFIP